MTQTADDLIASLRQHHDRLAEVIAGLTPEQLDAPSAAEKWSIAQVLSHLGSGAEIFGARYAAALSGSDTELPDNQAIWARWDASTPQQQAEGYLEHDEAFVARLEGLDGEQRTSLRIDLGFGGDAWPLEAAVALRLNEVAAHAWDVHAGLDASARLDAEAADLLLAAYAGELGTIIGWATKPDRLDGSAVVAAGGYGVHIDSGVTITPGTSDDATATLRAPHEAVVRLVLGRLKDGYTAPDVSVDGNVTLDQLRQVFPGY